MPAARGSAAQRLEPVRQPDLAASHAEQLLQGESPPCDLASGRVAHQDRTDDRLVLTYQVVDSAGRTSRPTTAVVLVSAQRPSASRLRPRAVTSDGKDRVIRDANSALATAIPSSGEPLKILNDSSRSQADWKHIKGNRNKAPYKQMDFAEDGCSDPTKALKGAAFDFTRLCVRHDFGYRNALWSGVFNKKRPQIDKAFYADMVLDC